MKRGVVVLVFLMIIAFVNISAQNPNLDRLNAYKVAFFTQRMNLSPREAEKFWPLYNDYQERKAKIQAERVQLNMLFNQSGASMSDRELAEMGDKYIGLEVIEAGLSQEFYKSMKEVLPPAKIFRYYQAENQYKLQLLKELQERRKVRNNLPQR